jgi:ABC-type Mn2+/Zn2+ transport system permease subunit
VNSNLSTLAIAIMIGASSGAIGSFVLLRRMALAGDALSHVALPGIALAIAYHIDPFWGVVGFLLPAATLVWWLEGKTQLHPETLIGLLFTSSLAVGILTIPEIDILESLFGSFPSLSLAELLGISTVAALLIVATLDTTICAGHSRARTLRPGNPSDFRFGASSYLCGHRLAGH